MKVLVIEDDEMLRSTIAISLTAEKYLVETADTFKSALDKASTFYYDCILLDIGLPGGSGLDILKVVKELQLKSNVIIISAKDSLEDKLSGLDLGADDYLAKPFHLAELNARIKAVIRRHNAIIHNTINFGNLELNLDERKFSVGGIEVELFRKEFDILYFLMNNPNRLLTKSAIAEYTWGDHYEDADNMDFVYSQVKNLRKKLAMADADCQIKSTYGVGYKLCMK